MKNSTKSALVDPESSSSISGKTSNTKSELFPIVGIGASAGGLEALEQFFTHMPENCGMAFVVIQHLDPNHKGIMVELLQRITQMKVYNVTDRLKIKPNCVYVIPPNASMSILNGSLHLFEPIETRGLRLPVDFFFRSLADDQQGRSIGIILSGMGSDGSTGMKAIKENAGLVLVQDPASAKFDSMPRSAMDAVIVDIVAPAHELPAKLINLLKVSPRANVQQEIQKDSSSLEKIIILLRSQTGNDFSQYKKTTLYRRIERRMGIHQIDKIASYVRYLRENPAELEILFKELLIGVTNFFRDGEVWEHLKDKVIPSIIDKLPHGYVLRAWIPGCSTGEEAYSLAIVFKEAMENLKPNKSLSMQIFATDLDVAAIERARKGIFPSNIVADISSDRLNRFFLKTSDQYRVNAEIREMVVFASQNVIKDPPFTKLDLLSCRNLLIYLDAELQKKLLALFHYSLNPGGMLVLGSAETNAAQSDLFTTIDAKFRIYQRSGSVKKEELVNFPSSFTRTNPNSYESHLPAKVPDNLQALTDQLLLQQFTPASLLVTDKGDILYITGSTGKYLEPAAGKANMNIFAMAREGLRNELPMAFRNAMLSFDKMVLRDLKVISSSGVADYFDVTVQQIEKPLPLKGKILIIFNDVEHVHEALLEKKRRRSVGGTLKAEVEYELQRMREELQSTREEMQTSQEELQSTNEEMQSTNEELQSTNEELTTSKEEMQSLNEELHTVNAELQSKIDDAARINNDMNNLLNSIDIATLFLDKDLKIRQYTHPATKIFKLIQSDIGRLFTDQVTDLDYPELYNEAKEVLRTLRFVEKAVATRDGRWFNIRIMPYRTFEDKIDGLVITFIEITQSKVLENALMKTQRTLQSFIQVVPGVILGLSSDGKVIEFNPEAEKLFACKRDEVMSKKYIDLFIPEASRHQVETDLERLMASELPLRFENRVKAMTGDQLIIEWSAHPLIDDSGKKIGMITIGTNITKNGKGK
ncbi:MAG TPA: chemotaxis protein CheB [Prolixibacteraceae bacterium]|jgi:two-component system CheB/CheR fusion protein